MHFLIDGYNVLFQVGILLNNRAKPQELQKARLQLLDHLTKCFGDRSNAVTVVFDARKAPAGLQPRQNHRGIQVIFTNDEEADDLIEALIVRAETPAELMVVSDDHRLRDAARAHGCPTSDPVDFWLSLDKPAEAGIARPPVRGKPDVTAQDLAQDLAAFESIEKEREFRELFEREHTPFDEDEFLD